MKAKCKSSGCYEPADCRHGYCSKHCHKTHSLKDHTARIYPANNKPHMGVEIEVEFNDRESHKRGIMARTAHHDGSLEMGAEYKVLSETKKIARKASMLVEELWSRRAKVGPRTGLHVHIDVRGIDYKRIRACFAWLRLTQEVWFNLMPASRRNNKYVAKIVEASPAEHYTWAHATPYNTIEIRLHGGTLNPYKLAGWLAVMAHLQAKIWDANYEFPSEENGSVDPETAFWALFAAAPKEAREYLNTRKNGGGVVRDYAFQPLEEINA